MNRNESVRSGEQPLESWKEIAAYLQRDATTVRRWEKKEGLPVHRHAHQAGRSVYAYPSEIDAWRSGRKVAPELTPRPLWKIPAFAVTMLLCLVMVGNGVRPVSAQQGLGINRRLCTTCEAMSLPASVTPDGRWMTPGDEDVTVRDLVTGKEMQLTTGGRQNNGAEWSVLSPDQRQVASLWFVGGTPDHAQIRVMDNRRGSQPRIVLDNPEFIYFEGGEWYPDGKSLLLVAAKPDHSWQFIRLSVADGTFSVVKSVGWRLRAGARTAAISPDGRYIAFDALVANPPAPPTPVVSKDTRIFLLAADGSSEAELTKTAGSNSAPVWTRDGTHILFFSDISGTTDLWSIAVKDGKPAGSPSRVMAGMGRRVQTIGMTRSGAYYFASQADDTPYVTISQLGNRERSAETFVGLSPAWSPDGKSIAVKRRTPGSDAFDVVVRTDGDEKSYSVKSGPGPVIWFSDSGSFATRMNGSLQRLDLKTGETNPMPDPNIRAVDRLFYAVAVMPQAPSQISSVDMRTLEQKTIYTAPAPGAIVTVLSPNKKLLAIRRHDNQGKETYIAQMNVDGSGYQELFHYSSQQVGGAGIAWEKDGKSILFGMDVSPKWQIMRISAQGGTPEQTGIETRGELQGFDLSPDGSHLAYSSVARGMSVWALDNVLSVLR